MHLAIDVSGPSFADSASVRVLVIAARTLTERGGGLVLLRPQHEVARLLEITGADQMITIRGETRSRPRPGSRKGLPPEPRAWTLTSTGVPAFRTCGPDVDPV